MNGHSCDAAADENDCAVVNGSAAARSSAGALAPHRCDGVGRRSSAHSEASLWVSAAAPSTPLDAAASGSASAASTGVDEPQSRPHGQRSSAAVLISDFVLDDDDDEGRLGGGGGAPAGSAAADAEQVLLDDDAARMQLLGRLNALRRSGGKFCDVVLRVGQRQEMAAHRAVLAAASPFFDAALASAAEANRAATSATAGDVSPSTAAATLLQQQQRPPQRSASVTLAIDDDIDVDAFEPLLSYAYTGRLCVRPELVRAVYQGAAKLCMPRVVEACGQRLHEELTLANCLDTLLLAARCADKELMQRAERFIQAHFGALKGCRQFASLPRMQVKIYGAEPDRLAASNSQHVCQLVIDWLSVTLESRGVAGSDLDLSLDRLCKHEHLLYLTADNRLRDCAGIDEDTELGRSDCIVDYKKMTRKQHHTWSVKDGATSGCKPQATFKGTCRIIASHQDPPNGCSYVCLSVINGCKPLVVSLLFSPPPPLSPSVAAAAASAPRLSPVDECSITLDGCLSPGGSSSSGGFGSCDSCDESGSSGSGSMRRRGSNRSCGSSVMTAGHAVVRPSSFVPLATMSAVRCGVGLAVLSEGKLAAVGGHDRGECLDTVEAYSCEGNYWQSLPAMNSPRGRFECEQIQGRLYACGGSDGRRELDSVECLDVHTGRWTLLPDPMAARKSSAGVGVVHDRLYVVGGWSGQLAERSCEMYDPIAGTWQFVAPLAIGRSQAAVCSFGDSLYAFGGQDSWTCFNTAEVYDRRANKWLSLSPMPYCRRGAGAAVYRGKIYLVGGSDGSAVLRTTHIYDPATDSWSEGPSLITSRVNVGVAVGGGQLYAVGGFSGKEFLNSIERLDADDNSEWCSYARTTAQPADEGVDK